MHADPTPLLRFVPNPPFPFLLFFFSDTPHSQSIAITTTFKPYHPAMVNTPPPPNPAPQPGDSNATNQGHIDRDVNSILANLNHEQLASIVAAAVSNASTA
jgi:hypothetical protein